MSKTKEEIMKELEFKKQHLKISRAKAAKEEYEMKIVERELEIAGMQEQMVLQDEVIEAAEMRIAEMEEPETAEETS